MRVQLSCNSITNRFDSSGRGAMPRGNDSAQARERTHVGYNPRAMRARVTEVSGLAHAADARGAGARPDAPDVQSRLM